jgi:hypothetical protein
MTTRYARRGAAPVIRPVATVRTGYASRGRSGSVEAFLAEARATGAAIGAAYRAARLTPDQAWVARTLLTAKPAFRSGLAGYDRGIRWPAVRSAADDAWVAAQIAKRERFVRDVLAPLAGIPPELALEAARTVGLGPLFAHRPGELAL